MLQQERMIRPRQIARDVADLARRILGDDIDVIWFGSWPKGTAAPHADIDIAVAGPQAVPPQHIAELRAQIEELPTLHKIDLVDLQTVSESFKQEILHDGIRL